LWLHKYRKDLVGEDAKAAMKRLFDEGCEVEKWAYKLFPGGFDAYAGSAENDFENAVKNTKKLVKARKKVIFQPTISNWDIFCRADIIKLNPKTGEYDIYEVKSSTEVKDIHLIDLAFQKICFEVEKIKIGNMFLVHINNKYVRDGQINPQKLLVCENITDSVKDIIREVGLGIEDAQKMLANKNIEPDVRILKQCRNPHDCDFIHYCWRDIPDDSIYEIAGSLRKDKLEMLLNMGILQIKDIPEGYVTNGAGMRHLRAIKTQKVFIDYIGIKRELAQLEYPLYFLDYETFNPAIPLFDGYRPYQRIVFQYSLHIKNNPSAGLMHYDYLCDKISEPTNELAESLANAIGKNGSVIAWNKSFETGCNNEMSCRCGKKYAGFFESVNERIFDLMQPFKKGYYVHKKFKGSCSIKKVLPVLAPDLSYKGLNIREGSTASESWLKLTDQRIPKENRQKLARDMQAYCQLDTLAMVKIHEALLKL